MNEADKNSEPGLRCLDADACALGQKPCPTPAACGCAPQAQQVEALRIAGDLEEGTFLLSQERYTTAGVLRAQHSRIAELEDQLAHMADIKDMADAAPPQAVQAIDVKAIAGRIAEKVAKNCGSVPQLTFPHIYLGLKELVSTTQAAPQAVQKCEGCNGNGVVGGLLPGDGGYHSEECPFCKGSGEDAQAAPQAVQAAVPDDYALRLKIERGLMERSLDEWVEQTGAVTLNSSWHSELASIVQMAFDKGAEVRSAHPAEGVPSCVTVGEREAFEQAFITEKLRLMDCGESDSAVHAIRMCHLKRYGDDEYPSLEACFAWFAWQARAAIAATQPAAQALEADGMYYVQDARHHAMVGNCPSFWREGGGYTTNLDEAERFTLEAAMKQHKCRETDLPWLCTEVDKLRRPTVDCQYMPRSWDAQRAALAAQAKQGGA